MSLRHRQQGKHVLTESRCLEGYCSSCSLFKKAIESSLLLFHKGCLLLGETKNRKVCCPIRPSIRVMSTAHVNIFSVQSVKV